jgi:hypothetical protein
MKRLITTVFATLILACAYAQTNEPGNNIGRTLSQMKQLFPELRYTKTDSKGTQYEDGYPQDGIATFFYFKDNKVIEECMIVQSNDGFPRMWFDKMVDSFVTNYPPGFGTSGYNAKHWCYSTFSVHLIFVSENNINTAMIVYEAGGWKTGITGADFIKKYK